MRLARPAALLTAAWLLGACATLPVGTDGLSFEQRRAELAAVETWEMRGRLAIDTGGRAFQGSFNWRQNGETLELGVRGPLGAGVLQVQGAPDALSYTARGETRTLTDPEAELSALLGWWLPVASLPAWLLGLPDATYRATTEPGPDGTLALIDQRLWRVSYASYRLAQSNGNRGVLVPRRIDLTHNDLTLRVTVDAWQPAARATP
jgi:outer membrane lipoprotein LolB